MQTRRRRQHGRQERRAVWKTEPLPTTGLRCSPTAQKCFSVMKSLLDAIESTDISNQDAEGCAKDAAKAGDVLQMAAAKRFLGFEVFDFVLPPNQKWTVAEHPAMVHNDTAVAAVAADAARGRACLPCPATASKPRSPRPWLGQWRRRRW